MKELSIEEKAKRYDQAIERAESIYNETAIPSATIKGTCTYIFPELKESEDEKIRKDIISYLALYKDAIGEDYESWIAWLEKQSEQKYIPKYKMGDYVKNTNYKGDPIYEIIYMDKECYICEYRGKERMGDKYVMHFSFDNPYLRLVQKPSEWSEEDEKIHKKCICAMRASAWGFPEEEKFVEQVDDWLKSLKGRIQSKPASWSKEDEKIANSIWDSIDKSILANYGVDEDKSFEWLKSLKDRVLPQPKQEWNEEEEEKICCKK